MCGINKECNLIGKGIVLVPTQVMVEMKSCNVMLSWDIPNSIYMS